MLETMDAMFLVYTAKLIETNSSDIFLRHLCKFQSISNKTWRSVRKRSEGKYKFQNMFLCVLLIIILKLLVDFVVSINVLTCWSIFIVITLKTRMDGCTSSFENIEEKSHLTHVFVLSKWFTHPTYSNHAYYISSGNFPLTPIILAVPIIPDSRVVTTWKNLKQIFF